MTQGLLVKTDLENALGIFDRLLQFYGASPDAARFNALKLSRATLSTLYREALLPSHQPDDYDKQRNEQDRFHR